nr:sigma-70 family RNA polymerase sigma factor [Crassaminicella profunda]
MLGTETDEVLDEVELKIQVKKLYQKMSSVLKNRERTILQLRYGLANDGSKTQREIAKLLGISRSYVSRIEKRAIKKLSKAFHYNTKKNIDDKKDG